MSYAMDKRKAKGTAMYTRKLLENILDDERFDFYLVHYEKIDDPLYGRAKEIIMPKIKLPYGSHFLSQMLFFWRYRKNKFDLIHWFQPRLYPFFWLAPAKKLVVTAYDAGEFSFPGPWVFSREVFKFILKKFNRKVDAIIAASKYGCEEIAKYYQALDKNIFCTYLGGGEDFKIIPKVEAKKRIFKKYGINQPFILQLARHLPNKNNTGLVKAYKIFRDCYGRKEKLVVVGTKDFDTKKILELSRDSGYQDDIIFIYYVEAADLNYMYAASELFVFPSFQEGFGLPLVEAMAAGVPIITSNIASLPEVAGAAALLVNPYDSRELAKAIYQVLTDEHLKVKLVKNGLVQAAKFSWRETGEETKKIYLKLMAADSEL